MPPLFLVSPGMYLYSVGTPTATPVPVTALTTNPVLNVDSRELVETNDLSSVVTGGSWFDDPFSSNADRNNYNAVPVNMPVPPPAHVEANQTGTFRLGFQDTSSGVITESGMLASLREAAFYKLCLQVCFVSGDWDAKKVGGMFRVKDRAYDAATRRVYFEVEYKLPAGMELEIYALLGTQYEMKTIGFGKGKAFKMSSMPVWLEAGQASFGSGGPKIGLNNKLTFTARKLGGAAGGTYTAKVYYGDVVEIVNPNLKPKQEQTIRLTAGQTAQTVEIGGIALYDTRYPLHTIVRIYDSGGKHVASDRLWSTVSGLGGAVEAADLGFEKASDSSFIYVNDPEYITRYDIVDSPEAIASQDGQLKIFEQQNLTGKNTYYQTHLSWWGKGDTRITIRQTHFTWISTSTTPAAHP